MPGRRQVIFVGRLAIFTHRRSLRVASCTLG
jgi:hypothetical protein